MRKLPNGVSNYEKLIKENRVYVDKTMYIEKLENLSDNTIMFLRPRKFGKTLFTSTLEYYYDKLQIDQFDTLFKDTYIGKNPTHNKNRYCVLRFNFSGISTANLETTLKSFKESVAISIKEFIRKYNIDFTINLEYETSLILNDLFTEFKLQKPNDKIYVIIDEYDHFANELLGFRTNDFKNLLSKNGELRKWYEILKKGTESVIDRIFITGVAPITLDSTTSGFNIARDITKNINFNDMLGFSQDDVKYLMNELDIPEKEQQKLLPIIKSNYDGYVFSDDIYNSLENYKMYNSNMTLYFLNEYQESQSIPRKLIDVNIISDYRKIEGFMDLYQNITKKTELLEKIVANQPVESNLTEKFNAELDFGETELISLLYYLGYLTICSNDFGILGFASPNDVIRKIYTEYFLSYIQNMAGIKDNLDIPTITREFLRYGKIDTSVNTLQLYLTNLSNRDYINFDEKYIKLLFYAICKSININVKSELEISGNYSDLLLIPKENINENYSILIEFKYIKKEDYEKNNTLLKQKQLDAKNQLEKYRQTDEIKMLPNLKCYSIVAIKDKVFVQNI